MNLNDDSSPWPNPGDLCIIQLGGAPGLPVWTEHVLWLGNDFPRGIDRAYLYLTQDGDICRTFSSQLFIVVRRFNEAVG